MIRSYPTLQCYIIMLKPRGFVPWGLPGPTRGRSDAAALASKTKGTARMGGRVGVGPTDSTFPLPMQPSGRPWASKRTPGMRLIPTLYFSSPVEPAMPPVARITLRWPCFPSVWSVQSTPA